ncbi:MAG: hypothetical protein WBB45_18345 [Cyclobacteriaceae bacterium]
MKNSSEIADQLCGHGDIREIALITGYNVSYVRKVLEDVRKNSAIHDIALDVIGMRKKLRQKYAWLKTRNKPGGFEAIRDVENVVIDMHFRPYRKLLESGLRRLEAAQGLMRAEPLIQAKEEFHDYDRHILNALNWLTGQRVLIEPHLEYFDLWPIVKEALTKTQVGNGAAVKIETEGFEPSVFGDQFLLSSLIRAIVYHLRRITSPEGRIVIKSGHIGDSVNLLFYSHQCLLPKTSFELLNNMDALNLTRTRYDDLEALAVAGHFIMGLQDGYIQWTMPTHRNGIVKVSLPDGLKLSLKDQKA